MFLVYFLARSPLEAFLSRQQQNKLYLLNLYICLLDSNILHVSVITTTQTD